VNEKKVRTFENTVYDELQPGASATVNRRVSAPEVEALALVSGDVDSFHLDPDGDGTPEAVVAKAVGGEAIISGMLTRRLPGPGTTVLEQELKFEGAIAPGDELTGTVTVPWVGACRRCLTDVAGRAVVVGFAVPLAGRGLHDLSPALPVPGRGPAARAAELRNRAGRGDRVVTTMGRRQETA